MSSSSVSARWPELEEESAALITVVCLKLVLAYGFPWEPAMEPKNSTYCPDRRRRRTWTAVQLKVCAHCGEHDGAAGGRRRIHKAIAVARAMEGDTTKKR